MRALKRNAPFIRFLVLTRIYCLLVYIVCFPFSSLFPYLSPPLSFSVRIDPLCFQAGCCKRLLNLALVFLHLFCVVVHFV